MADSSSDAGGLLRDPARFATEVLEPIRAIVGERGVITIARGPPSLLRW